MINQATTFGTLDLIEGDLWGQRIELPSKIPKPSGNLISVLILSDARYYVMMLYWLKRKNQ